VFALKNRQKDDDDCKMTLKCFFIPLLFYNAVKKVKYQGY